MNADEVDKIIAEALAESKGKKYKRGKTNTKSFEKEKVRRILNMIFMIGAILTFILYFVLPDHKVISFTIGGISLVIKIVDYFLRFMF